MDKAMHVVLTNLQARLVRAEKELQIHDKTRQKQTERNDEILRLAKEHEKDRIARRDAHGDPYV